MSKDLTTEAVERAVRFDDIKRRAQAATPVTAGKDILKSGDRDILKLQGRFGEPFL